jgi:hypothetical protein
MQRDKPAAADLLNTARALLRDEMMAHLPASQKLNALMIASAMAMAGREVETGDALEQDAAAGLRALYPDAGDVDFTALNARLAGDIRSGRFDDDETVYRLLFDNVKRRLAISNPRYLAAAEND